MFIWFTLHVKLAVNIVELFLKNYIEVALERGCLYELVIILYPKKYQSNSIDLFMVVIRSGPYVGQTDLLITIWPL